MRNGITQAQVSDLLSRVIDDAFSEHDQRMYQFGAQLNADRAGWKYSRWPQGSPAWQRAARIERMKRRLFDAWCVLVHGATLADEYDDD